MIYHLFWNGLFDGRFEDRAHAIEVFQRHNDEVQRIVPADRLLVYRVLEGWEPLCEFLGVPVPQHMPFPRANTTEDFLESVAAEQKKNRFLKLLREYNAYAKYWGREIRNLLMSKGRSLHSQ